MSQSKFCWILIGWERHRLLQSSSAHRGPVRTENILFNKVHTNKSIQVSIWNHWKCLLSSRGTLCIHCIHCNTVLLTDTGPVSGCWAMFRQSDAAHSWTTLRPLVQMMLGSAAANTKMNARKTHVGTVLWSTQDRVSRREFPGWGFPAVNPPTTTISPLPTPPHPTPTPRHP